MLTKDDVSEAVYKAADCNHDGVIDSFDVALLEQAGALLSSVDQSKSEEELITDDDYMEYVELMDQTPDEQTEEPDEVQSTLLEFIIKFVKIIIEILLTNLPIK